MWKFKIHNFFNAEPAEFTEIFYYQDTKSQIKPNRNIATKLHKLNEIPHASRRGIELIPKSEATSGINKTPNYEGTMNIWTNPLILMKTPVYAKALAGRLNTLKRFKVKNQVISHLSYIFDIPAT